MIPSGEKLTQLEKELSQYMGEDKIVSSRELATQLDKIPTRVFKTGVASMDRILEGIEPGELIVVTGPSGQGKTTFLMSITKNLTEKAAWFTLEVTPKQFLKKIIASDNELPLFYLPAKNIENNIDWLLKRIIEAKVKFDTNIIFIDHLHQIFSIERVKNNTSLEIGDVVAQIKKIAIDYGLTIFLIAHNKDRIDMKEPQMADIRDSGMICRLADTVMGIWRVPNLKKDETMEQKVKVSRMKECGEDDNWSKVRIWKNRREGKLGFWFMTHKNHYLKEYNPEENSLSASLEEYKDEELF